MNKFFKDMTTGKDNETHDLVRVLTLVVSIVMVISFIAAAFTYLYGYFYSLSHTDAKMFDMQTFFNAESLGVAAIGTFFAQSSWAIKTKKDTEPDGTVLEETSITKGRQPDTTNVTVI